MSSYKTIFDILGSIIVIIILGPLYILISILIKLDSKGPIIHKRLVLGKDYKKFYFYKFRTMVEKADKVLEKWKKQNPKLYKEYRKNIKLKNDPRLTELGAILRKTSIDELPQFFNVLKGEMSIVGPRPVVENELEKFNSFNKEEIDKRFSIKPGITGYWQTNGRQNTSYDERIKADLYYAMNKNFLFDLKILLKTVKTVIKCDGAL